MKLKFTLERPDDVPVDLVATFDSQATVGGLADFLLAADPDRRRPGQGSHTITLHGDPEPLSRDLPINASSIKSGDRLELSRSSSAEDPKQKRDAAAVLRLESGPGAPQEYELGVGSVVLGREAGCDIVLPDPMVSRRHVRITVGESVQVQDLGSANGSTIGSAAFSHATLRPTDLLEIGDTLISVRSTRPRRRGTRSGESSVSFVRSPLITPHFLGEKLEAPQAPERQRAQRFPRVLLFIPLIMAIVMYEFTKSTLSLVFMGMSPMMIVGGVIESRRNVKLDFQEAVDAYEGDLVRLGEDLERMGGDEARMRVQEHPPSGHLLDAARRREPLLWSRRPDVEDFLQLRIGLGRLSSRTVVEVPKPGRAPYELWQKAQTLARTYATVGPVPVVGPLRETALGVAGPREAALASATSLVVQTVTLHSPAEVVVCAFISPDQAAEWDWLKWLPHCSSPQSPLTTPHIAVSSPGGAELLTALEELIRERDEDYVPSELAPAVVVVVDIDPPGDHDRLVHLAEAGPSRGVYLIWIAPEWPLLPAACRTFVSVDASERSASVGVVTDRVELHPIDLDLVSSADAAAVGRHLAPVADLGARVLDSSDIPRSVSQLTMLGPEIADDVAAVIDRWSESASILTGPCAPQELPKRPGNLRAVLGQSAQGPHTIDLRSDGPHALVGGTTGAGKSELLQSWVLAMAAAHSPQRINFLFVDYKGGAAFAECEELPHSIGVVTDLSPHLVRRSLTSLKAELHYRENLLNHHKAKDLVAMERRGLVAAPPSLVIIVDEFAALAKEVPEFVDGVVDVAQRGRSLGLHLILATQRPAGVIGNNLRANTNLRIALRMNDADDSTDVLGLPDAAFFDKELPGRAMSRSGPRSLVPFQASYSGGWTSATSSAPEIGVHELSLSEARPWSLPDLDEEAGEETTLTDIQRIVERITAAAAHAELPTPRRAWMPDLPTTLDLATLPLAATDDELVFGLADDPAHQTQPPASFRPDREGHLVVYGTSGSGKSTALRTLAIAAGYAAVGTPTHIYGLDFGSRGLDVLEVLPHVGSIIPGADHERVTRLLKVLRAQIDERAARFAAARATSLTEYRERTGRDEPRILLLLDGLTGFRSAYEVGDRTKWLDLFVSILADGRQAGIHVAMTSDQRSGMTLAMASSVQRRLVLRMASPDDYGLLGAPGDVLDASSAAGRALDGDKEVQIALLGDSADVLEQSERMQSFGEKMVAAGVTRPPAIASLPEVVPLSSLPDDGENVAFGLAGETLEPCFVVPSGGLLLSGPTSSGRTTALHTLVLSARRTSRPTRWYFLGQRRSPLVEIGGWESLCVSADEAGAWADAVTAELKTLSESSTRVVIVLESAGDYANSMVEMQLQAMVRTALSDGHWVIAEGEASTVVTGIGFLGLVKASRSGLVLQPDQEMGGLYKTPFPRINSADFPPGRGLLVKAGRTAMVQVAVPYEVAEEP